MSEIVPAISLWQPWASLLFTPAKPDETRHWPAPARIIGQRVAIHAAKRPYPLSGLSLDLIGVCNGVLPADWRANLPRGAVIGTAVLATSRQIGRHAGPGSPENEICGNWAEGRYTWRFTDHRLLLHPVPVTGRQGFFTFDLEQADA